MIYGNIERDADFEWFLQQYDKLYAEYGHKFFAIRNKEILDVFDSACNAIDSLAPQYEVGEYIVQECTGDESGYTMHMASFDFFFG